MAAILSPRVDAAAKLTPNSNLAGGPGNFAMAEGLTESEASELAAWLREAGYPSIEIVHAADSCSVRWNK